MIDLTEEIKDILDIEVEELKESLSCSGVIDFVEILTGCVARKPTAWVKLVNIFKDHSISVTQKIPIYKLGKYISGVQRVEDDLRESCKLSNKLFGDEKTRNDNGFRLYKYVTETETEEKIEFLVETTRGFLLNCIDVPTFFRMYKAIAETLPEDLIYLSRLAEERLKKGTEFFEGNMAILALARSGLMIIAGDDGNKGVEEQDYTISSLGFMVDRYALSFNNEKKQRLYKTVNLESVKYNTNFSEIPLEEIDDIVNRSFSD